MRTSISLFSLFFIYFLYGFYVSQLEIDSIPSGLRRESIAGFYDYKGLANIHSSFSTGSSSPLEILPDAKKAGLDFLIFTDINQYTPTNETLNGYFDNLLVMTENEYTFLDSRLIYISENREKIPQQVSDVSLFFTNLLSQAKDQTEANIILAHPFNPNSTWTGEYPQGLDGIEILNPKSLSQKMWLKNKLTVIMSLLFYTFNPRYSFLRLFSEPMEELALWDQLTATKNKVYGYAGADASARAIPLANYLIKFPSYQKSLEIVSNHLLLQSELTGNFLKDRQKIYRAFKKGQFYFSLDLLGNPKGFISFVNEGEKIHLMGSSFKFKKGQRLLAQLPIQPKDFFEIVLVKDGEREAIVNNLELNYEIKGPGVYRIFVRVSPHFSILEGKKWLTWIYTNPFFVTE